jgi:hypothetical protein
MGLQYSLHEQHSATAAQAGGGTSASASALGGRPPGAADPTLHKLILTIQF